MYRRVFFNIKTHVHKIDTVGHLTCEGWHQYPYFTDTCTYISHASLMIKNASPRSEKNFFFRISAAVYMGVCAYMDAMPLTWRSQGCMDIQRARPFTLVLINFIPNCWWGVTYLTRQTAAITLTTSVIMLVWFASIDLASKVRPSSLWKTMLRPYWKSTISNNQKQGKMKGQGTIKICSL